MSVGIAAVILPGISINRTSPADLADHAFHNRIRHADAGIVLIMQYNLVLGCGSETAGVNSVLRTPKNAGKKGMEMAAWEQAA